ncbi:unnamed protein product [Meloidogyne enterolobii]|uniref:Uncharacterized protein n=1 Tax=Meloidogyne enterolobii TaxID=390850 RepID=A0ACB0Z0F3_MELEN
MANTYLIKKFFSFLRSCVLRFAFFAFCVDFWPCVAFCVLRFWKLSLAPAPAPDNFIIHQNLLIYLQFPNHQYRS